MECMILHKHLKHYYSILEKQETAFYLLAKDYSVNWNKSMTDEDLWNLHKQIEPQFLDYIKKSQQKREALHKSEIQNLTNHYQSYLSLKIELAIRCLIRCNFCENMCRINRNSEKLGKGKCGLDSQSYISSAFLHYGEESPLIPSGTIFFSGCTFDCVFCQNYDISTIGKNHSIIKKGTNVDGKRLALFAESLQEKGAKNINYVGGDPTPNLHTILESMLYQQHNIAQLWNSNFFNSITALRLLRDIIDIWLPDLKFGNNECGKKYSTVKNYWSILTRNLKFIYDWGFEDIIIRHLVLPNHIECCSKPILRWISEEIPNVVVNIMSQYHPEYLVNSQNYSSINRRITKDEMAEVFTFADSLDIEYKFIS